MMKGMKEWLVEFLAAHGLRAVAARLALLLVLGLVALLVGFELLPREQGDAVLCVLEPAHCGSK